MRHVSPRILGVDFSGADDAGRKIWIAEGRRAPDGAFLLTDLRPACDLEGGGRAPGPAIAALARHIMREPETIAGCDFPFSLPRLLITEPRWEDFVRGFPARFPDPDTFRAWAYRAAGNKEIRRRADSTAKTPFNSYNLRIYRQTWWGIATLLHPLLVSGDAIIRPYQRMPRKQRPIVIEACPACTLKSIGFYPAYKGRLSSHRDARRTIVERLVQSGWLASPSRTLMRLLLDNAGGDALDSLIAAIATAHADVSTNARQDERFEGRIYGTLSHASVTSSAQSAIS